MHQWAESMEVVDRIWNKLKRNLYVKKILGSYRKEKNAFFTNQSKFKAEILVHNLGTTLPTEIKNKILSYEDSIMENKVRLFDSYVELNSKIDWQKDYFGGYSWKYGKVYLIWNISK